MGRPKGFVVTEEQKIAMKEGRIAARQIRAAAKALDVDKKPTIVINGQEEDGFDFWPAIRHDSWISPLPCVQYGLFGPRRVRNQ